MAEKSQNFMATLPGILTGIAAVITAVSGLYLAIDKTKTTTPATTTSINAPTNKHTPTSDPLPDIKTHTPIAPAPNTNLLDKNANRDKEKIIDGASQQNQTLVNLPSRAVIEKKPPGVATTAKVATSQEKLHAPFPERGPLVDCALFPTVNTVRSLMSWSNYYQKELIAANGLKKQATEPCNKTIDYRGMAHCKEPHNEEVRMALLESLTLCRAANIEWEDIRHSTILENN